MRRLIESISADGVRSRIDYEPPTPGLPLLNRGLPQRVTRTIDGQPLTTGVVYDEFGRPEILSYPNIGSEGFGVRYDYDSASGAITAVTDATDGTVYWKLDSADDGVRVSAETFGDGTHGELEYHPTLKRIERIATRRSSGTLETDLRYEYDELGRTASSRDATESLPFPSQWYYSYDERDQLISSTRLPDPTPTPEYTHDALGNLSFQAGVGDYSYSTSNAYQLRGIGEHTYSPPDNSGRITNRAGPLVPGQTQSIQYAESDLPRRITTGTGASALVTEFDYTASSERALADGTARYVPIP